MDGKIDQLDVAAARDRCAILTDASNYVVV